MVPSSPCSRISRKLRFHRSRRYVFLHLELVNRLTEIWSQVLAFLQTLLDSSFLKLLTYPPSHSVLRDILSDLEPELAFTDEIEQLRGPLEPFVRAHAKAVHEAAHGAQKPDLKVDWRRRRKEAHEQAGMAVGVYQIEELVL